MTTDVLSPNQPELRGNRRLSVRYHAVLNDQFDSWAQSCGYEPHDLRRATAAAIRHRHHDAYISHECHKASGRRPTIYTLSMGRIEVYYTIEQHAVVVRGYGWDIPEGEVDDLECGGLFTDYLWSLPA